MAINPNTDFTTGAVLTAAQQNRFPRGIMSFVKNTTATAFGAETTIITATAFTAVASRYYKTTFYLPSTSNSGSGYAVMRIKNGATTLNMGLLPQPVAGSGIYQGTLISIDTFSAGSVTLTATMVSTATGNTNSTTTQYGFLLVEDIGPA